MQLSFSPDSQLAQPNEIVTVDILADTEKIAIDGIDIDLPFTGLEFISLTPGKLMPSNHQVVSTNRIQFGQACTPSTKFVGSGVLCTLTFKVLTSTKLVFNFTPGATNETNMVADGKDILTNVGSAIVAIFDKITPIEDINPTTVKLTIGQNGYNDDVIVGGPDPIIFEPKVDLTRWKWGRSPQNINLEYLPSTPGAGTKVIDNQKVIWSRSDIEHHVYGKEPDFTDPKRATGERGNLEFDLVLKQKPSSNIFQWKITGIRDLGFFYQPALTPEEIANGTKRPDNVVGSYAVYHTTSDAHKDPLTTPTNQKIVGMESKAFHIYRPEVFDINNNAVWGDLNFTQVDADSGIISVTVPQTFIDSIDPLNFWMRIDPTFGYATIGATLNSNADAEACWFTSGSAGTLTNISVYKDYSSGSTGLGAALYSDAGSQIPGNKLAEDTGNATMSAGAKWYTMSVSNSLAASTIYWLCDWNSGNHTQYSDAGTANQNGIRPASAPAFESWPASWGTPSFRFARKVSIYATYTATNAATNLLLLGIGT